MFCFVFCQWGFRAGDHPGGSCGPEGKGYIVDRGWSWKFSRKSRNKELKSCAQPVNIRKRKETRGQFEYDEGHLEGEVAIGRW